MGEHIFFLDPLVQELFFLKNYWFKSVPYSWKYNQSIPLLLMWRALNNFLNPFMFDDGEQQRTGRGRPRAATETLCYSSQSEHTREIFFFLCLLSVFFRFFVFVFWPTETTTANLQGFTHLTPSKSTNQVTLRNKHWNHLYPLCNLFTKWRTCTHSRPLPATSAYFIFEKQKIWS